METRDSRPQLQYSLFGHHQRPSGSAGNREGSERRPGRQREGHIGLQALRLGRFHGRRHRKVHLARQEHRSSPNLQGRFGLFLFC